MNDTFQPHRESSAPGAALARARVAQNLSIIEVARHLKLTPAQVESLEAGEYDKLPGRVFVRGFVRNYAKLVRLDPAHLLRQIENDIPKPAPAPVAEMRLEREVALPVNKRSRWPLFAGIAFLIVAALAVYEFGFNEQGHDRGNGGHENASADAKPDESSAASSTSSSREALTGATTIPQAPSAPAVSAAPPAPATARPSPAPPAFPGDSGLTMSGGLVDSQAMQSAQARPVRPGEHEMHFRFDEDSWVEIRDRDNKIIFSKLNRAGAEERVSGLPPLRLVVGNARNVHLTYDARSIDLTPHTGVTVARLTLE